MPELSPDLHFLIFPAILLCYYVVCWAAVGRDPALGSVPPQYEPPPGIDAAVARYLLTGGSDGVTLAAVLASLQSKGVVSLRQDGGRTLVTLLNSGVTVMPDEAAVVRELLHVELAAAPYSGSQTNFVAAPAVQQRPSSPNATEDVDPLSELNAGAPRQPAEAAVGLAQPGMDRVLSALQETLRQNLKGVYFRWNFGVVAIAMAVTLGWGLVEALLQSPMGSSSLFLAFWLYFFTTILFTVVVMTWSAQMRRPKIVFQYMVFLSWIVAVVAFLAFRNQAWKHAGFPVALVLSTLLNAIFTVLMRAPTSEGRRLQQHLAGFRDFLATVDEDRLDRTSTAGDRVAIMDKYMPYAIALGVKEGWGDALASKLAALAVQR